MTEPFAPFLRKLDRYAFISDFDRQEIANLPHTVKKLKAHHVLISEGSVSQTCCFLISGHVARHKVVSDGGRQILAIHAPGDGVDLQNAILPFADHTLQALTDVKVAFVPVAAVQALFASNRQIARAIWAETMIDAAIQREWTVNVGRRDARSRLAHLLCELMVRDQAAGAGGAEEWHLPLTQDQLADCAGLTAVHVNRTLQSLRRDGLISCDGRKIAFENWPALTAVADFDPSYLYGSFEQEQPTTARGRRAAAMHAR